MHLIRYIIAALAIIVFASVASAQTVKTLGYNTTNGKVVYSGTNSLAFNNVLFGTGYFTNSTDGVFQLRFGATNTGFKRSGGGQTTLVSSGSDVVVFSSNSLTIKTAVAFENSTNAAISRTNLGLGGGITTNVVAGTNTLVFTNGVLTGVTTP